MVDEYGSEDKGRVESTTAKKRKEQEKGEKRKGPAAAAAKQAAVVEDRKKKDVALWSDLHSTSAGSLRLFILGRSARAASDRGKSCPLGTWSPTLAAINSLSLEAYYHFTCA